MSALSGAEKQQVITDYQLSPQDTGSVEVQVALLTTRIKDLTEHMKIHKKDLHTRKGLTDLVSKRRRLLKYIKKTSLKRYTQLLQRLGLRGIKE